jgi:hypothetical protein
VPLMHFLLRQAQELDRTLQLLTGLLSRHLGRRLSPARPSGELLSVLAEHVELPGETVAERAFVVLHCSPGGRTL